MLDKEKIKKEIESYKESMKGFEPHSDFRRGQITAYNQILQFIDSLPEEHINFPHERNIVDKVFGAGNLESLEYEEAEKLVLLAKEELLKDLEINKEPVNEDLEEEIENYIKNSLAIKFPTTDKEQIKADIRYIARHFSEWQKQQIMKKAVLETKVMMDCDGDGIETPYEEWLTLENTEIPSLPDNLGLKDGDKVKIIIIKEE